MNIGKNKHVILNDFFSIFALNTFAQPLIIYIFYMNIRKNKYVILNDFFNVCTKYGKLN